MKPKINSIWFSDTVDWWRAIGFTEYQRSKVTERRFGFIREMFYTKVIDLTRSETDILASFAPDTRRLIRRADKEGITYRESDDVDAFVRFFNTFAGQKNLSYWISTEALVRQAPRFKITIAEMQGHVLFSHFYMCDPDKSRAVILYGASVLKEEQRGFGNVVLGSANRGLHYYDMRLMKAGGYRVYDIGGYAPDTRDAELKKINDFKDQFGGALVCEANHRSVVLQLASDAMNLIVMRSRRLRGRRVSTVPASRTG
jgi:lipid II:glycine glycyltransferase (peptidoglycan interpeptide bridge formation enzyme)